MRAVRLQIRLRALLGRMAATWKAEAPRAASVGRGGTAGSHAALLAAAAKAAEASAAAASTNHCAA